MPKFSKGINHQVFYKKKSNKSNTNCPFTYCGLAAVSGGIWLLSTVLKIVSGNGLAGSIWACVDLSPVGSSDIHLREVFYI